MDAGSTVAAIRAEIIAEAVKASGAIVRVAPGDFRAVLSRVATPLVVLATGGVFKKHYQYLTSYKGLVFYTKSAAPLELPGDVELITADRIWIPG